MQPFQVYLRIKPMIEGGIESLIQEVDEQKVVVSKNGKNNKQFIFDRIFQGTQDNGNIFDGVLKSNLDNFIEGYNTSVLAYGITGSGKSHTIFGKEEEDGLAIRCANYIIGKSQSLNATVELNFYEVYNETIRDLLSQAQKPLVILSDASKGSYISGISTQNIKNIQDAREAINKGNLNRSLASTMYNVQSSRSHAIIQISLSYQQNNIQVNPKLYIVDLAGSEKVYTDQKQKNQQEGSNINRSLLALSHCLAILSDKTKKNQHIPYRNSKLTRLLQDSIGGNTRTIMIACIQQNKACYDEIINTLTYSSRATQIKRTLQKSITTLGPELEKDLPPIQDSELNSKQLYLTKIYNDIYNNIEEYYEINQSLFELQNLIQQNQNQIESIYQNSLQDDQQQLSNDQLYHSLISQQRENYNIETQLQHALKINLHQKQLQKSLLLQINEEQLQTISYWKYKCAEQGQEVKQVKIQNENLYQQIQSKDLVIQQQQQVLDQIKSKNPSLYATNDSDSYPSSFASSTSTSQIKKKPSIQLPSPKAQNNPNSQLLDFLEKPRFTNVSHLKYLIQSREKSPIQRMSRQSPFRSPLKKTNTTQQYRTQASISKDDSQNMSIVSQKSQKKKSDTHTTTINLFGNATDNKEN
ncbi:hypothetical protein pb186bvf_013134 [Paramecium bursaria]